VVVVNVVLVAVLVLAVVFVDVSCCCFCCGLVDMWFVAVVLLLWFLSCALELPTHSHSSMIPYMCSSVSVVCVCVLSYTTPHTAHTCSMPPSMSKLSAADTVGASGAAPPPPDGTTLALGYHAKRCLFCLRWSTGSFPYTGFMFSCMGQAGAVGAWVTQEPPRPFMQTVCDCPLPNLPAHMCFAACHPSVIIHYRYSSHGRLHSHVNA
jgi:hypothetical protein